MPEGKVTDDAIETFADIANAMSMRGHPLLDPAHSRTSQARLRKGKRASAINYGIAVLEGPHHGSDVVNFCDLLVGVWSRKFRRSRCKASGIPSH
jgi:hypothetical protein